MDWNFKREEGYPTIPEGTYRVRIDEAEKAVSKTGKDMIVLKLAVSGFKSYIWKYIVFMPDRPEMTNRMLTEVFDSFGIPEGDFEILHWVNKGGAAKIKHDEDGKARISYFLKKDKQADLPAWKEVSESRSAEVSPEDEAYVPF